MPELVGRLGTIVDRIGLVGEHPAGEHLGSGAGAKEIEKPRLPAQELGQKLARAAKRARVVLRVSFLVIAQSPGNG
jgi:hypothetical protein